MANSPRRSWRTGRTRSCGASRRTSAALSTCVTLVGLSRGVRADKNTVSPEATGGIGRFHLFTGGGPGAAADSPGGLIEQEASSTGSKEKQ